MSYSIGLLIIICAMSVLVLVIGIVAFKKGYELGVKDFNASHDDTQKSLSEPRKKYKSVSPDPELEKYRIILDNIENYDGTDAHQKEIN